MKNTEIIALSKAIKDKAAKAARKDLTVGEYEIDMTVQLTGILNVGKDSEKKATASLLNQEFFLLVLKHSGITREAAAKAVAKIADEYLENWDGSDEAKEDAKATRKARVAEFDPDGEIKAIFDGLKDRLPKVPSKGMVKFKGQVEMVEAAQHDEITEVAVAEAKEAK